ncbi:molybdopterin-dependent oxidoreductase [Segnochrobactraceae bacterium EtOH-i3]
MTETRTTCPYCGVGCGVRAGVAGDGRVTIRGDAEHPANFGRLCSKGSALGETLALDDRLLGPVVNGRQAGWTTALDLVARRFAATIAAHGPDAVAFYVSGQLLTEDYYVANKLMKGFLGSANIDTNSRLCMASSVAGHRRAFGADTVPGSYRDLETADLVVLVGSNLAWCHPVLYQRLIAAKAARPEMKLVVIDPRRTVTAEGAELFLPVAPNTDVALFNGLLTFLADTGRIGDGFVADHTEGAAAALAAARLSVAEVAAATGLSAEDVAAFYRLWAGTEKVVTVYSQGVNQSGQGTDKVNAITNCHLFTGRIGREGMGPFSVTGQPNAMGGREVGGLANQLAAHMDFSDADRDRVARFWNAPALARFPGLKAVDLMRAVGDGRVKAIWIMGTNPVVSMPDADGVRAALKACPFVVVSDVTARTDTAALAHVLLPAAAWGEKDGTVTNSERRISRQRAFLPLPGVAKPDWWIVTEVARRMGFGDAFAYQSPAEIFREHAALSAFENDGRRDFDLSGIASLSDAEFDALAPVQWPVRSDAERAPDAEDRRFFADGRFFTADGRGRFIATPFTAPAPARMTLNTGRIRDQWHTMTRTAKTPRLMAHFAEPFAEIAPSDARRLGITPASLVKVESPFGSAIIRALVTDRQRPGSVFVPMHWTSETAPSARVDAVVAPVTDPVSGQPASKFTPVELSAVAPAWYGFAVCRDEPAFPEVLYAARARAKGGWRLELAGDAAPADWVGFARETLGLGADMEVLSYLDTSAGRFRLAAFAGDRLVAAFFAAREPVEVSRGWAVERLAEPATTAAARLRLLAGRSGEAGADPGATVCSCFDVGVNTIVAAITSGAATDVATVGKLLKAGTNCGSCRAEIGRLCDGHRVEKAG